MKNANHFNGVFEFKDLGYSKFSQKVVIRDENEMWTFIRSKVLSRDIDWSYDPFENQGKIWVGLGRPAGTFKKVPR